MRPTTAVPFAAQVSSTIHEQLHLSILEALLPRAHKLIDLVSLEQDLACHSTSSSPTDSVRTFLSTSSLDAAERLRLLLVYAACVPSLERPRAQQMVADAGFPSAVTDVMLSYHHLITPVLRKDSTKQGSFWERNVDKIRLALGGSVEEEIDRSLDRFVPTVASLATDAANNTLSPSQYPYLLGGPQAHSTLASSGASQSLRTQRRQSNDAGNGVVLIFVLGGLAYSELPALSAGKFSTSRVIAGGSSLLTPQTVLEHFCPNVFDGWV